MTNKSFLPLFSGMLVLLIGAIPSSAIAQKKGSKVAANLEAAKELSAMSGRPILAVAGIEH